MVMPVRSLQLLVLEESRGRQHDVGVVGGVGEKLLVHNGEQIRALKAADHVIVVGRYGGRIRVVNEHRFHRRIVEGGQRLPQFAHVDHAGLSTQRRFHHQIRARQRGIIELPAAGGRKLQPAAQFLPRAGDARQHGDGAHR